MMIWLLPLLIFGGFAAASRSEDHDRETAEEKRIREIRELEKKLAEEKAVAAANKKKAQQYLAMKPTVTAAELYDLNGETPDHL